MIKKILIGGGSFLLGSYLFIKFILWARPWLVEHWVFTGILLIVLMVSPIILVPWALGTHNEKE